MWAPGPDLPAMALRRAAAAPTPCPCAHQLQALAAHNGLHPVGGRGDLVPLHARVGRAAVGGQGDLRHGAAGNPVSGCRDARNGRQQPSRGHKRCPPPPPPLGATHLDGDALELVGVGLIHKGPHVGDAGARRRPHAHRRAPRSRVQGQAGEAGAAGRGAGAAAAGGQRDAGALRKGGEGGTCGSGGQGRAQEETPGRSAASWVVSARPPAQQVHLPQRR